MIGKFPGSDPPGRGIKAVSGNNSEKNGNPARAGTHLHNDKHLTLNTIPPPKGGVRYANAARARKLGREEGGSGPSGVPSPSTGGLTPIPSTLLPCLFSGARKLDTLLQTHFCPVRLGGRGPEVTPAALCLQEQRAQVSDQIYHFLL